MIHRYYAPVQLLALSPILYLTAQKRTPASAGPLKVRGPIWSNRSNRPKKPALILGATSAGARPTEAPPENVTWGPLYPLAQRKE